MASSFKSIEGEGSLEGDTIVSEQVGMICKKQLHFATLVAHFDNFLTSVWIFASPLWELCLSTQCRASLPNIDRNDVDYGDGDHHCNSDDDGDDDEDHEFVNSIPSPPLLFFCRGSDTPVLATN